MSPSLSPPVNFLSDRASSGDSSTDAESDVYGDSFDEDFQKDKTRSYDPALRLRQLPSPLPSPLLDSNLGYGLNNREVHDEVEDTETQQIDGLSRVMNGGNAIQDGSMCSSAPDALGANGGEYYAVDKGLEQLGQQEQEHLTVVTGQVQEKERVLKLSPAKIYELTSTPGSLPVCVPLSPNHSSLDAMDHASRDQGNLPMPNYSENWRDSGSKKASQHSSRPGSIRVTPNSDIEDSQMTPISLSARSLDYVSRSYLKSPKVSTTPSKRRHISSKVNGAKQRPMAPSSIPSSNFSSSIPPPLQLYKINSKLQNPSIEEPIPSPMPQSIPVPPFSLPTYLQLELSSSKPSPLYIHRSVTSDFPYESSHVKIERLQNFLLLPFLLEQVLWFGALACLDAWLFSFTILPLRFLKALSILIYSWGYNILNEARVLGGFIYSGTGRVWRRRRRRDSTPSSTLQPARAENHRKPSLSSEQSSTPVSAAKLSEKQKPSTSHSHPDSDCNINSSHARKHHRYKSTPSALLPEHKADILKGFLILISCTILMHFDASRMYHGIRGQAAIKLYVIYNVLEVSMLLASFALLLN